MNRYVKFVASLVAAAAVAACGTPTGQRAVQTSRPATPAPAVTTPPVRAAAAAVNVTATVTTTPTIWPKAITSDSILWDNRGAYYGHGWWVDVESERQAYTRGAQNKRSHWEAVQEIIPQTGRTLIVVDNAWGVTDEQWRRFVGNVVALLPDDKCLVFVAPYFSAAVDLERHEIVAARAAVLREEIAKQPCHTVIPWDEAAAADPSLVKPAPDGQHPTAAGATWLQQQIFAL